MARFIANKYCGDEWHYNSRCQEREKRVIVFKTFPGRGTAFGWLLRKDPADAPIEDTGMRIALHFC